MAHTTHDLPQIQNILHTADSGHVLAYNGNGTQACLIGHMTRRYGNQPLRCKLYRGYHKIDDDVYWLMQCNGVVKAHYTKQDLWEREVFEKYAPTIKDGETYYIIDMTRAPEVFGLTKTVAKVNGDYSNAAEFTPVDF